MYESLIPSSELLCSPTHKATKFAQVLGHTFLYNYRESEKREHPEHVEKTSTSTEIKSKNSTTEIATQFNGYYQMVRLCISICTYSRTNRVFKEKLDTRINTHTGVQKCTGNDRGLFCYVPFKELESNA